jgi:hypothetical protein
MQKENRVVVLARNETTYGVDAIAAAIAANASDPVNNPHPYNTDALLCAELDVSTDTSTLERGNYNPSLSPDQTGVGRVLGRMTFRTELRSSGAVGVAPRIGRLFKACNMAETIIPATAAAMIGTPVAGPTSVSAGITAFIASLAKTTPPNTCFDTYRLTVTTAGAAAASQAIVTSAGFPEYDGTVMDSATHAAVTSSAAGTVTVGGTTIAPTFTLAGAFAIYDFVEIFVGGVRFYDQFAAGDTVATVATRLAASIAADARFVGTAAAAGAITVALSAAAGPKAMNGAITLGASGAVITPGAWVGNTALGDTVDIPLRRSGVRYDPVSDNGSSITLWAFLDGSLFRLRGARGSWAVSGQAAQYATITWTFTGVYVDPIDLALPTTLSYETSKPYKVELAALALYGLNATLAKASRFSMDIANEVAPKDNINADEAYDEVMITGRAPVAGADPESYKPSVYNPWARLRREDTTRFHVAVGRKGGAANTVRLQADNANLTAVPFANRQKIRAYDHQLRLARKSSIGDDELFVHFG